MAVSIPERKVYKEQGYFRLCGRGLQNHIDAKEIPVLCAYINCSPESFDVNVHPQKLEVRFSEENQVCSVVYHGVKAL